MKMPNPLVFLLASLCFSTGISAQSDSAAASHRALLYADSLINAFRNHDLDRYLSLSYPGIVQYYGGRQGYREYLYRLRSLQNDLEEHPEKIQLIQIAPDNDHEWQCVVRKSREGFVDGKKALVISYLVGRSADKGRSWKYADVAYNSVENIVYIMPDISERLNIPQRQVIYEKNVAKGL
ncbi:MAG TPA: hypothetical protein PK339_05250 [Flavitalea sp.]|nr:hypothetical protein [Flavitalea sp.]